LRDGKLSGIDDDPSTCPRLRNKLKRPPAGGELISVEAVVPNPSDGLIMSAYGTKRTSACALHMSAIGGKADIAQTS
jgi:hypothetical protein